MGGSGGVWEASTTVRRACLPGCWAVWPTDGFFWFRVLALAVTGLSSGCVGFPLWVEEAGRSARDLAVLGLDLRADSNRGPVDWELRAARPEAEFWWVKGDVPPGAQPAWRISLDLPWSHRPPAATKPPPTSCCYRDDSLLPPKSSAAAARMRRPGSPGRMPLPHRRAVGMHRPNHRIAPADASTRPPPCGDMAAVCPTEDRTAGQTDGYVEPVPSPPTAPVESETTELLSPAVTGTPIA